MQNLLRDLTELLSKDDRLVSEGKLLKNKVIELALKMDSDLIKLLLKSKPIKKHFFTDVDGVLVFDKIKFQKFVSNKEFLPDSYTAFKNKIGLVNENGNYLSESKEVVLAWPYKDCVLEGGQTKEDQKRDEIFWNETLAPDEIDRLLAPKVFTNFIRYDTHGERQLTGKEVIDFSKENLIIKGNNLLSLHSLKAQFRGYVKLIYIDPPFNTASAANTFSYNNNFNHSAWLTFIKNRIEIAKEMLSTDGIFVTAIDHYELFYLGVLCDEVFGRENRMGVISVVHNPGGRQDDAFFPTAHENMLFYAKDISSAKLLTLGSSNEKISQYVLSDRYGNYKLRGFRRSGNNSRREQRPELYYPIYYNPQTNHISLEKKHGHIEILPIDEKRIERCWRWGKETLIEKLDRYIEVKRTNKGFDIYIKEREDDYKGEKPKTIWDKPKYTGQTATNELKKLFGDKVFSYPKSHYLIMDVLKISTEKDDIVMDFFGGSGTTAHAVLELNREDGGNRQFIICEQMDYVETVTTKRVVKVVEHIGKGEFIYCELMKYNEAYIQRIRKAKTAADLLAIWKNMQEKAFISYRVEPKAINENISDFEKLTIDEKKRLLIEILDKNQLYVNYSEMDDAEYRISETDKKLNRKFYEER